MYYSRFDYNVHLGVVPQGLDPQLIPGENDDRGDRIIVWIHNDRAREIAQAEGILTDLPGQVMYNHWEGIEARQRDAPALQPISIAPTTPRLLLKATRSREESDDTDDEMLGLPAAAPQAPQAASATPAPRRILECRSLKNRNPAGFRPAGTNPFSSFVAQNDDESEESEEE